MEQETGKEAVARADGIGHAHAETVVGEDFAVTEIHRAVLAEGDADVGGVGVAGEVAQVLFEAVVGRAEGGGEFVKFIVVELLRDRKSVV